MRGEDEARARTGASCGIGCRSRELTRVVTLCRPLLYMAQCTRPTGCASGPPRPPSFGLMKEGRGWTELRHSQRE